MAHDDYVDGVLLDELAMTLDEFARACAVEPQWIVTRVEAELIGSNLHRSTTRRFTSADLIRARRLAEMERIFEANQEAAAFMVDLIEEVHRLRELLKLASR